MNDEKLVPKCGMRELIWKCLDKSKALELLIGHGFGKTATSPLATELAVLLQTLLGVHDMAFDENDLEPAKGGEA